VPYLSCCMTATVPSGRVAIFFFQAEDGIRDRNVTGVQTCALPICRARERDRRNPWLPQAAPGLDRLLARNSNSAHRRDPPTPGQSWDPTSLPLDMTESHPPRW